MTGASKLSAIADAMQALPVRSVVLDGEGVICGPDGKSDFDAMRACFSRNGAPEAFLYAFDLLELDGRDLRNEPWARRRALLVQLLADANAGSGSTSISRTSMAWSCVPASLRHGAGGDRRQAA
jgi:bifunctional non-homologous end joining protein LigD